MRYVNFNKIKDLLIIINQRNGELRAKDLEEIGVKEKIFINENGTPMSHSPRYHYRKVMENLGLISIHGGKYFISENFEIMDFLKYSIYKKLLTKTEMEFFSRVIVENEDCQRYFFDVFMDKAEYSLDDLREIGNVAIIYGNRNTNEINQKSSQIKSETGKSLTIEGGDQTQAILWGVRLWALDLGVLDEIILDQDQGRLIYPISKFNEEIITLELLRSIDARVFAHSKWAMVSIPNFIERMVRQYRFSITEIRVFLISLWERYRNYIEAVPTSTGFMDSRTVYAKQKETVNKIYLLIDKKYISNLRFNVEVVELMKNECRISKK